MSEYPIYNSYQTISPITTNSFVPAARAPISIRNRRLETSTTSEFGTLDTTNSNNVAAAPNPTVTPAVSMTDYCSIPAAVELPLRHTTVTQRQPVKIPALVTMTTTDLCTHLRTSLQSSLSRGKVQKKKKIIIKLWMSELMFTNVVLAGLLSQDPNVAITKTKSVKSAYVLNLKYLEFLFGKAWWSLPIYSRAKDDRQIVGYMLVNDHIGISLVWSQKTSALTIVIRCEYATHAGHVVF